MINTNRIVVIKCSHELCHSSHTYTVASFLFPCSLAGGIMGNDSGQMPNMEQDSALIPIAWASLSISSAFNSSGKKKTNHEELLHLTLRNHLLLTVTIATDGSIQATAWHCELMKGAARFHETSEWTHLFQTLRPQTEHLGHRAQMKKLLILVCLSVSL